MADVEEKTEEVVEEKVEDKTPDIPQDVLDLHKDFDAKMDEDDSEEDNTADDDKASDDDDGSAEGKKPDDKTEEADAGKQEKSDETQQTAEEKEIAEAADALEKEMTANAGKTDAQKQADADAVQQAADAKAVAEAKAKEDATAADTYESDLDPEEWDKETIELDNKRGQAALDAQKVLEGQNAHLQEIVQQQANQRNIDFMDRKIEALGPDFHEILGEGEWEDQIPGSEQDQNRKKLGARMDTYVQAYANAGKPRPSNSKLFKLAVNDVFKTIVNKPATDADTAKKLADRKQQVMGKGSKKASKLSANSKVMQVQKDFDKLMDDDD